MRKITRLFTLAAAIATAITTGVPAAIVQTNTISSSPAANGTQPEYQVNVTTASSTDLIDVNSPTLLSSSVSGYAGAGGGPAVLNNGTLGVPNNLADVAIENTDGNYIVTYLLDTSIAPDGYDISQVKAVTGYPEHRLSQTWELLISTIYDPTFVSLGEYFYRPSLPPGDKDHSTLLSLTDSVGFIARNVTGVRFVILPATGSYAEFSESAYREFDVLGQATIPEPAAATIALVGSLLLLRRRRSRLA